MGLGGSAWAAWCSGPGRGVGGMQLLGDIQGSFPGPPAPIQIVQRPWRHMLYRRHSSTEPHEESPEVS